MEKFKPTNIKGASDNLPQTQVLRNQVTDIFRRNFESYGYLPIETATLNYLETLTYKYDKEAEIVREIYKLKDQADRDLGLRYDLTVPFSKFIATNRNLKMPFRRYEIGKVFRNGPVKAGRLREFYQCDIDVVGESGQYIEAELLALVVKCFLDIGIEPIVKYGNRKVLIGLIQPHLKNNSDIDKAIGIIDKIDKVSQSDLIAELSKLMPKQNAENLLKSFQTTKLQVSTGNQTLTEGIAEIQNLQALLKDFGIEKYCMYTPSLARGLNIYTSTVWEVIDKKARLSSSLGGGGRYDTIIADWIDNGQKYPAIGIGFGLEPIMVILEQERQAKGAIQSPVDLLLISMNTHKETNLIATKFRSQGKKILVMYNTKIKNAFEYANKENIPFVSVIGQKELDNKIILVKNMQTGKEEKVNI